MAEASVARTAIIVVDPQPDFFEGGTLPVPGATATALRIAAFLDERGSSFDLKIVTQDWHVDPAGHWSDHPDLIDSWPVHCAADTPGAQIHSSLARVKWDVVIHKGMHQAAYSGFDGVDARGAGLGEVLSAANVSEVTVVGFATDYCVRATALDAAERGLAVTVPLDLCAGVSPDTTREAIDEMAHHDVVITHATGV